MKTELGRSMSGVLVAGLLLGGTGAGAGEESASSELRVHEWGTFTTLHWSSGSSLGWYQNTTGGVSELPGFVHGYQIAAKSGSWGPATARMETPVL